MKYIFLILLLLLGTDTFADTYSYVKSDGTIVFTDDVSKIPRKQRNVRKTPDRPVASQPISGDTGTQAQTKTTLSYQMKPPEVQRQNAFYEIGGYTFLDVRRAIYRRSPYRPNNKVAAAWCQWHVAWNIRTRESGNHCDVASVDTRVAVIVTMPRWINYASAGSGMKETWDLYYASILAHEDTHASHGLAAANDIQRRILDMGGAASCRSILEDGNRLGRLIISEYREKDVEFDRVNGDGVDMITDVEVAADKRDGVLGRQYPAHKGSK